MLFKMYNRAARALPGNNPPFTEHNVPDLTNKVSLTTTAIEPH